MTETSQPGASEFSIRIEKTATLSGTSYVDALLKYCADHMLDPEDVAHLISKSLKEKLESDFISMNMLPARAKISSDIFSNERITSL
jgi:hypothetical protein